MSDELEDRLRSKAGGAKGGAKQDAAADTADLREFLSLLDELPRHPRDEVRYFFDATEPVIIARAPGRLDVMGGIADYSGSLVLQRPIAEATFAALQQVAERSVTVISLSHRPDEAPTYVHLSLDSLAPDGEPLAYAAARLLFSRNPEDHWAAYVVGVFLVLMREHRVAFKQGARLLIASRVPEGKGVSSSAALEVAAMQAVAAAYNIEIEPRETALLCQRVENLVVGAPCGVMDQMTAMCGEEDALLALLCRPAELQSPVRLPEEIALWGIDSGERHAVSGSDYGAVRTGAFMGYRIIAELAGLKVEPSEVEGHVHIVDKRWHGYLTNLSPAEFEREFLSRLPEEMAGGKFLDRYQGTTDEVTQVDRSRVYKIRRPAVHPIYEHHRVRTFRQLLLAPPSAEQMSLLGELMFQSHESYGACGLGSHGTDLIVELVRAAGAERGLYGARITGGGSGGTVAVLGRRDAHAAVAEVARAYEVRTGHRPHIFSGSSPGAAKFGTLIYQMRR